MMKDHNVGRGSAGASTGRRRFLEAMAGVRAGTVLAGLSARQSARAASATAPTLDAAGCGESVQDILNAALIAERIATTFYYTGLTTTAIARDHRVAGYAANPNAVSRNGDPANVAYLQAALDQEDKHARILSNLGATAPYKKFYFPASTFEQVGYTSHAGTFLWTVDHLETTFISAYLAAIDRFGTMGRADLALLAARFLGVECEHRALYRVIAGDDPADNVTLEVTSFACVGDAARVLTPFLTGHGFPGRATAAIPLPEPAHIARVVGKNRSA